MDLVEIFQKELRSLTKCKLPISRQKISLLTKSALRAMRHYKHVVQAVERFIAKCPPEYKVAGLYTVDAIVRQSLHQYCEKDVFVLRFSRQLPTTIKHVAQGCEGFEVDKAALLRVLQLWMETEVFHKSIVEPLLAYVESPSQREAEFLKAQQAADNLVAMHEAKRTHHRPAFDSSQEESSLKDMKAHQFTSPVNPSPRSFTADNASHSKSSLLHLPDVLQGTSQVKTKSIQGEDFQGGSSGFLSKSNGHDPPLRSLIDSLKTLMQRAGEEKIGCAKELEALQALVVDNVQRLSSDKSMRGAEMTELAQLLSQLADRASAHAQDAFAKAQQQVLMSRRSRLNRFTFGDEDVLIAEQDRRNEQMAEEEMRSTEWFVRSLREISRNLSTAGSELIRREMHGGHLSGLINICGLEYCGLMTAESPPPCPNFSLREMSPTKHALEIYNEPKNETDEVRYAGRLPSPPPPLPSTTVFDYQHAHKTLSSWEPVEEYEDSDAEHITEEDGGLSDERMYGMKRSRSSGDPASKRLKRDRQESPDETTKSEEKHRRTREKERRRQGLPPIKPSRVGVLSRTVFIGRLPKLSDDVKVRQLVEEYGTISALQFVPPRGCAFVTYQRRKHAAKAVARLHRKRLDGREIRVEWAPNKGINDSEEFKSYWDENEGCAYVPESKFPVANVENILEGGAELDEESIPESLMERIREKALASELQAKRNAEASSEPAANITPPQFVPQTLPPIMGYAPPMYAQPHPRAVGQPLLPAPHPMPYPLPPPMMMGPIPPPHYPPHPNFVNLPQPVPPMPSFPYLQPPRPFH